MTDSPHQADILHGRSKIGNGDQESLVGDAVVVRLPALGQGKFTGDYHLKASSVCEFNR